MIRRIHGDLHLGNIVLLDDRPVLFDAIEFSEVIASGDVLYDLAFLLMDLVERNLAPAANIVFNRYLVEVEARRGPRCARGAAVLPVDAGGDPRQGDGGAAGAAPSRTSGRRSRAVARKYFDWARRFIAPAPPVLVAVGGLSGTGKSVLARALAPTLAPPPGAVVLRSDVERKALFGKDELEPLPPEAYAPEVTARVYAAIIDKARRAVAAGHSADRRRRVRAARRARSRPSTRRRMPACVSRACSSKRISTTRVRRAGSARARRLRRQCRGGARTGSLRSRRARTGTASTLGHAG